MGMASVLMCTACGFNFLRSSIQKQMDAMSTEACAHIKVRYVFRKCQTSAFHTLTKATPQQEKIIWASVTSKIAWSFPCSDQRQADFDAKSCPDCAQDCVLGIDSSGDPTARVQGTWGAWGCGTCVM